MTIFGGNNEMADQLKSLKLEFAGLQDRLSEVEKRINQLEESINGMSTGGSRNSEAASGHVRLTPGISSQPRSLNSTQPIQQPVSAGSPVSQAHPPHILKVDSKTKTYPSNPMTPDPVPSITPVEGLKLCPAQKAAGKEVEMLPCELYGIDVDVSQTGIWFDGDHDGHENELVSVLEKIDKKSAKNIAGIFTSKTWENRLNAKITKVRGKHAEYQRVTAEWEQMEAKRFAAEEKLHRSPNDAGALAERRLVIEQFREVATRERALRVEAKLNITPGQIEKEIRLEPYGSPGEAPKGCPTNPKVNMVKIKIHDDVLDISDKGIWFDQAELVRLLESFESKGGGFAGFLTNYSKHKNTILDAIKQKWEKVERHTEIYQEYRELIQRAKRHSKSSDECRKLKAEADVKYAGYVELSIELDRIEDLTPKLSLGGILAGN
jgi:hypothetical protein